MKIDLHVHSSYSMDGEIYPKEILKYAKKIGLGGVAITDHNNIKGSLEAFKIAEDILIIRGIEISAFEGHVLAYGISENVEKGLSIAETIEKINDLGGIAVAAHPFRFGSGMGKNNLFNNKFDGIEIMNGRNSSRANIKACKASKTLKRSGIGGSDGHIFSEFGRAYTICDATTEREVIDCISKNKVAVDGISRNFFDTYTYFKKITGEWFKRGFKRI